MTFSSPALYLGVVLIVALLWCRWRASTRLPFPPGPLQLPIIGNLRDLPHGVPQWELYDAIAQKYGDVVYLDVLGQSVVVLSSLEAINDLLEKRSAIYSSRPRPTMMHKLMGFNWSLTLMEYSERWRQGRKLFHQSYNTNETHKYYEAQLQSTHLFLRRTLEAPDDLVVHIRHLFAKIIMKATYGIDIQEDNDPYIRCSERVMAAFNVAGLPGRYLVDMISILKYIPAWPPGASFQQDAIVAREASEEMINIPFDVVKEREQTGRASACAVSTLLEEITDDSNREEQENTIRRTAAVAFAGGSDTTVSALQTFFLAMILYPKVQQKAQAELDAVVGPGRLPDFNDRMVIPLGVPHLTSESDEYRGYYIPKGTVVIGNAYMILHDSTEFPEPHEFIPERFLVDGKLNPEVLDPEQLCFGFGRRICPGRAFAKDSLFSVISSVLHTLNITHAHDTDGIPIPVRPDVTD